MRMEVVRAARKVRLPEICGLAAEDAHNKLLRWLKSMAGSSTVCLISAMMGCDVALVRCGSGTEYTVKRHTAALCARLGIVMFLADSRYLLA